MDEQRKENQEQQNESVYTPRPARQVWEARIGLAVFVIFLILYYINIFRGGA